MTKITDAEFEAHCQKIQSYFRNAIDRYQWLVPHLNDRRRSSIDINIQAKTDYDFAVQHFEAIVKLVKDVGLTLGLEKS